jgi:phosphohistidine phosphatase SixA
LIFQIEDHAIGAGAQHRHVCVRVRAGAEEPGASEVGVASGHIEHPCRTVTFTSMAWLERIVGTLARCVVCAVLVVPVAADPAERDDAWAQLRSQPNMVLLMRHMSTSGGDPLVWDRSGNCEGEMRLSAKGRGDARELGERLRAMAIRPTVISSPMCRCLETSEQAFGERGLTDPDLREVASADGARAVAFNGKAREMLMRMRGERPVMFISHRPNIDLLTLELVADNEGIIGRIRDDGQVDVIARVALF